jgi:DNA (cytosine-5)-methyltransferase 1
VKILNLYAGIGGNRKLWGDEHQVTAVELNPQIAAIYKDFFPNDEVIVADAHQYLLEHYAGFDFIWSSPPCITHSRANLWNALSPYKDNSKQLQRGGGIRPRYADMTLYQEIIFLKKHYKGKWCVENVIAYYEPLIKPVEFGSHWFWTNFPLPTFAGEPRTMTGVQQMSRQKGFDLDHYKSLDKEKLLRNCVEPELGKHILDWAIIPWEPNARLAV